MRIEDPLTLTYTRPRERVLFNAGRDANPFFHLYEAMWMLAGRNDVASVAHYVKRMETFSDNGITLAGAYGYRWREYFGHDQLNSLIDILSNQSGTRRAVLQMWSPEDLENVLYHPTVKDVPCNLSAVFEVVRDSYVNMTVFNRSNDLIWGSLGANFVHFSFLQEYIACSIGRGVGNYHQVSANAHTYLHNWEPQKWLNVDPTDHYESTQFGSPAPTRYLFKSPRDRAVFDQEVVDLCNTHDGVEEPYEATTGHYQNTFLRTIVHPMMVAHYHHKKRDYQKAFNAMTYVQSWDWKKAGDAWLARREVKYESTDPHYDEGQGV